MFINQSNIYYDALILVQTSAIIIWPFFFANCLIATVKFWSASFQLAAEIKTKTITCAYSAAEMHFDVYTAWKWWREDNNITWNPKWIRQDIER